MPVLFFDPGMLTARLELEAPQAAPDGQGGAAITHAPVAALWARIEPVAPQTRELASAEGFVVSHRIWCRYRQDVAAGMRFRKGARSFAIKALHDPDETRRYLVCLCEEDPG